MHSLRFLEICCDLDGGGSDRYVYNYCTRINNIHFDYSAVDNRRGILEPLLEEKGSLVFHVPQIKKGPIKYYKTIKSYIKSGNYDGVHIHLGHKSFLALLAAKKSNVKTRIVHAHIAFVPENPIQRGIRFISTLATKHLATDLAACGVDAAKWVWGKKTYEYGKVRVINNAIETKQYAFDQSKRIHLREQLGIQEQQVVVGHVGRLSEQKNQIRLLEIFAELQKICGNAVLIMIGQGEMEKEIQEKIIELNIANSVKMLGVRKDVADLLNIMDVFVFPSKYEGLPFTLIETQCNGLRCLCSDTVTSLVDITGIIQFVSLDESNEKWAEKALQEVQKGRMIGAREKVVEAGYDIDMEALKLEQYYKDCIKRAGERID